MKRLATLGFVIAAGALVASGQLTITTTSVPPALKNQPYPGVTLQVSGDPGPIVWSFPDGGPPGFTVVSTPIGQPGTNGTFCYGSGSSCSGLTVQTLVGQYTFTIQAASLSTNQTATQSFNLVVEFPLQIVTTTLPNANANQAYSAPLVGFGGTGQYVWSILNGTLPPGIGLDGSTGALAGTAPGGSGVYLFTIQLLDQVTQEKVTQPLGITVVNGVAILTTSLPNATLNQPYQFPLSGTGQNLVWSIPKGSQFPPGFNLSSSGVITGVGTSLGAVNLPVQLANGQAPTAAVSRLFTLMVTLGPLGINELTLPSATQNVPYSTTLTPSGGIPPYTWSLGVGSPQGLSIGSASGIISGTLTTSGSFPVLVALRDTTGAVVAQNYTLNVGNAVTITTTSLPSGPPNVAYSATLAATGGSVPYHWSVLAGILPTGLTLISASGQIIGTPTAQGAFQFTVQVTDFLGGTATKALSITIGTVPPLTITTALPGASLNQPYSGSLTATGGTQPVTWTLTSGNLPTGLTLNPSTGAITGTPTVLGPASFTVQALDSARQTASKAFTLTVAPPVTMSAADFTTSVGAAVSQTATASGGVPPYTFSVSPVSTGSLPGGLQIGASTGVISGTPTATGVSTVTLQATDAEGRIGTASITITVNSLPLTIVIPASPGSGQQPGIGVSIPAPATGDISGTLSLAFASSVGGDDKMVRFAPSGSLSIPFTITKGNTTAPNATVITGTVAGTITLTASVPGSPDVIKTIVIAPAVPVISSVTLQQVTGGLNVVVSGYSNTREVSSGSFTFTVSSGNTLSQATITVPLTSAYATWFNNTSSNATGGQFKLTVPFSVTQGSATAVTKVAVTLTNTQGASAAVSSP